MNNIVNIVNRFYKVALEMPNETAKGNIEALLRRFVETTYDKHINDQSAPQDDKVVILYLLICKQDVGETRPTTDLKIQGNTPQIESWAKRIFAMYKVQFMKELYNLLKKSEISPPFLSEAKVERVYE